MIRLAVAVLITIATAASAQFQAVVDTAGSVVDIQNGAVSTSIPGYTAVAVDAVPPGGNDRSVLLDEFGRCKFRVVSGSLRAWAAPRWQTDPDMRDAMRRALISKIDDVTTRILAIEAWQRDYSAVVDRSAALAAARSARADMIAILTGQ